MGGTWVAELEAMTLAENLIASIEVSAMNAIARETFFKMELKSVRSLPLRALRSSSHERDDLTKQVAARDAQREPSKFVFF